MLRLAFKLCRNPHSIQAEYACNRHLAGWWRRGKHKRFRSARKGKVAYILRPCLHAVFAYPLPAHANIQSFHDLRPLPSLSPHAHRTCLQTLSGQGLGGCLRLAPRERCGCGARWPQHVMRTLALSVAHCERKPATDLVPRRIATRSVHQNSWLRNLTLKHMNALGKRREEPLTSLLVEDFAVVFP